MRRELGPVAVIGEVNFVRMLPKTRSGKIMRRVFKAVVLDHEPGDISTIEDAGSVEEARAAWRELRAEVRGECGVRRSGAGLRACPRPMPAVSPRGRQGGGRRRALSASDTPNIAQGQARRLCPYARWR